jgi:predicted metal-dependent phosphoesterase TrpH
MNGRYYSAHMHMHSSFEGVASMQGHIYRCNENGIEVIWFTDHDTRIGLIEKRVNEFFFETPQLETIVDRREESLNKLSITMASLPMTNKERRDTLDFCADNYIERTGFKAVSGKVRVGEKAPALKGRRYSMELSALQDIPAGAIFSASGKRNQTSLLTDITFTSYLYAENFDPKTDGILIDIVMSQQPPGHKARHLYYYAGIVDLDFAGNWALPFDFEPGIWNEIVLNISQDVLKFDEFGQDNCFCTVAYTAFSQSPRSFTVNVGGWEYDRKYIAEEARKMQQELGARLGDKYGVTVFAATEISSCGQHKNSHCTWVPVIDYRDIDYKGSAEYAVEHVKKHNGIISYNHPFVEYKRYILSDESRHAIALKTIEKLIESRCDEAAIIEIGYPHGRACSLDDHLLLWDRLAAEGLFLTGVGCSDNHSNDSNWTEGNNFATWIFSKDVQEKSLIDGLKSGNVFTGDPVLFRGGQLAYFVDNVHSMGSAVKTMLGKEHTIRVDISGAVPGSNMRIVSQGRTIWEGELTDADGRGSVTAAISVIEMIESPRIEVYAPGGRCMLLSNPVYLISDDSVDLPNCRLL